MSRYIGCLLSGLVYSFVACGILIAIEIGDCDPLEKLKCEAARSGALLVLAGASLVVACLLIWLFFMRHEKRRGDH